ncbi:MAG TPA: L-seryl-tRNA(Sec) selenium transferase [Candidatus Dormibacteraeota bacterium]|nr:L-seryl-tRNA(Sec) selenium transferase [Candidatus Dormibacteraeota bacterium]
MAADPASRAALRTIPSVDELLGRPGLDGLCRRAGRALVLEATREVLAELRAELSDGASVGSQAGAHAGPLANDAETLDRRIAQTVEAWLAPSLRPVINATGVVLHTNLGRAPISREALGRLREAAAGYSNLEYDLSTGARGKRDAHTARLLSRLLGAESAIVVNNNAAAVFLVLHALAREGEVIVSRGELIEIGDGFRIPDILASSGARLREVGTTNRTRLADYEAAIGPETRLVLRVHPSNFRIVGFTERPSLEELVALGRRSNLPVCEDLGSGCLVDLKPQGIDEPVARASFDAGVSIATFSGDKLLGGPQAGIIAGQKELVGRVRRDPLFRALRVDKLTIAALEATLHGYLRGAPDDVPVVRMIREPADEIRRRAEAFAARLAGEGGAQLEIVAGNSVVGGGSTPGKTLPTWLVAVRSGRHSAAALEERLRHPEGAAIAVIARIENDRLVLDLRTVFPDQEEALAAALAAARR